MMMASGRLRYLGNRSRRTDAAATPDIDALLGLAPAADDRAGPRDVCGIADTPDADAAATPDEMIMPSLGSSPALGRQASHKGVVRCDCWFKKCYKTMLFTLLGDNGKRWPQHPAIRPLTSLSVAR
jgi:hypothetical protein